MRNICTERKSVCSLQFDFHVFSSYFKNKGGHVRVPGDCNRLPSKLLLEDLICVLFH